MDGKTGVCGVIDVADHSQEPGTDTQVSSSHQATQFHESSTVKVVQVETVAITDQVKHSPLEKGPPMPVRDWHHESSHATSESEVVSLLRHRVDILEVERNRLEGQAAHDKMKIEGLEATLTKTEERYEKIVTELKVKLSETENEVDRIAKETEDRSMTQIRTKDQRIKKLQEAAWEDENTRTQLEADIQELKRQIKRMTPLRSELPKYHDHDELTRVKRQLDEENALRLTQVAKLEKELRTVRLHFNDLKRNHDTFLTVLTQIWEFSQTKDPGLLAATENEELRQKITQLKTAVSARRKVKIVEHGSKVIFAKDEEYELMQKNEKLTKKNESLVAITTRLRAEKEQAESRKRELEKEIIELSEIKSKYETLRVQLLAIAVDVSTDQSGEVSKGDESAAVIATNLHQSFKEFKRSLYKLTEEAETYTYTREEEVEEESTTYTAEITVTKSIRKLRSKLEVITQENMLLKWCLDQMNTVASSNSKLGRLDHDHHHHDHDEPWHLSDNPLALQQEKADNP